MAWATQAELVRALPNALLFVDELTAGDQVLELASILDRSTSIAASYLRERYGDQFSTWDSSTPLEIKRTVLDLAMWDLVCRRINPQSSVSDGNSPWLVNYKRALEWLRELRDGKADLPLEGVPVQAVRGSVAGRGRQDVFRVNNS
jgi:hypothetical protein